MFRHAVSNAGEVLAVLRQRRHVLALEGHIHAVERISYELEGRPTRFEQTAGVAGTPTAAGLRFRSGVTPYRVRDGVVDAGRSIPLGMPAPPPRP